MSNNCMKLIFLALLTIHLYLAKIFPQHVKCNYFLSSSLFPFEIAITVDTMLVTHRSANISSSVPPQSLLSAPSIRERETKRVGAEILELLNKPTAKERSVVQHFRSQGSSSLQPQRLPQEQVGSEVTGEAGTARCDGA